MKTAFQAVGLSVVLLASVGIGIGLVRSQPAPKAQPVPRQFVQPQPPARYNVWRTCGIQEPHVPREKVIGPYGVNVATGAIEFPGEEPSQLFTLQLSNATQAEVAAWQAAHPLATWCD